MLQHSLDSLLTQPLLNETILQFSNARQRFIDGYFIVFFKRNFKNNTYSERFLKKNLNESNFDRETDIKEMWIMKTSAFDSFDSHCYIQAVNGGKICNAMMNHRADIIIGKSNAKPMAPDIIILYDYFF